MNTDLVIKYNFDRFGQPKGAMTFYMDQVFKTKETKSGEEKLANVMHVRKILKFIFKYGSQENITQLHDYLSNYSKSWLVEFKKFKL